MFHTVGLNAKSIACARHSGNHQRRNHIPTLRRATTTEEASAETVLSARKSGLAFMLDDGTRKSHSVAENTGFVTGFFRGIAEKENFAKLVAGLYFVYEAMEDEFERCTDPSVKLMDFPELRRVKSLEVDMEYYYGSDWRTTVKPSLATKKYVDRIKTVAEERPTLLLAHQYTRYLGDLFGGQMMGKMATNSLGLEEGKGISFYHFEDIPDTSTFIEEWYTKLNTLPMDDKEKQDIVDEANEVFRLNILLFDELEGNAAAAMMKLALRALKEKLGFKTTTTNV